MYAPTFSVPFLFDDVPTIPDNLTLRHWATALAPPANTAATGRPIVNLSLAINYAMGGTRVWGYHAANLAIHVLAGFTLFGLLRRLLAQTQGARALPVALGAAAIWTLHPLQTESVTYIVQRAESLMGLLYLLTIYAFVRWRQGAGQSSRAGTPWAVLSVVFCGIGMATKEVMATAPLAVLFIDRLCFARSLGEAWRRRRPYYLALCATWLPLAALVWHGGIFRDLISPTGARSEISGYGPGGSAWQYWATQPEAVTRYLRLAIWPHPLVFDYGTQWLSTPGHPAAPGVLLARLLAPAAVVAVALAVTVWGLYRNTAAGLLGFCFFAVLAPTSVIPGDRQTSADHRMYLALIPVALLAALGVHRRLGRSALPVCLALAGVLGVVAARRNGDYSSEQAIWSDTVSKCPGNYFARFNLGSVLSRVPGRLDDAIAQFEEGLRLRPDSAEGHVDLGNALSKAPGRLEDAVGHYGEALRLKPDLVGAHIGLGNALSRLPGRLNDGVTQLEDAVRLAPGLAVGHFDLGIALARMPGRMDDAIAQYRQALRLNPDLAPAHFSLAVALLSVPGHTEEAKEQLEEGLRISPDDAQARRILSQISP